MEDVLSAHAVKRTLVEWLYVMNHCHGQYPELPLEHGADDIEKYGYAYFFKRSTLLARRAKKNLFSFLHSRKIHGMHAELLPKIFPGISADLITDLGDPRYVKELDALYRNSTSSLVDPTLTTVDKIINRPENFGELRHVWAALHKLGNVYYGWLPEDILEAWSWGLCYGAAAGKLSAKLAEVSTAKLDSDLMVKLTTGYTPTTAEINSLFSAMFTKEQFEWIKATPTEQLSDGAQEAVTSPLVNAKIDQLEETRWAAVTVKPVAPASPPTPDTAPTTALIASPKAAAKPAPAPVAVVAKVKEDVVMVPAPELDPKLSAAIAKAAGAECGAYTQNGNGRFVSPSDYLHSAVVNAVLGGLGQIEMVLEKKRDLKRLEALTKIRRALMDLMY